MEKLIPFEYAQCNFYRTENPMWMHAPRSHSSPNNLIFVTYGVLYIEMNDERYTVNPNEFLFLPQGLESTGYRPSGVKTGFYFVTFKTSEKFDIPTHFTLPDHETVRDLYAQLIRHKGYDSLPQEARNAFLATVLYEVKYQLDHSFISAENDLSGSIKQYIRDTITRNLPVSYIASHFGFCPDYLNRVFYRSEHITIKEYISNQKIRRIEEYLSSTDNSIKRISEMMNFPNPSALTKFYKYHTGNTPFEYRLRFKKQ